MITDKRNITCNKLADMFEKYLIMDGAMDYSEAQIMEDAPNEVKKAHEEYIKLKKEIRKDRAKMPFV